jgi:hypothetical protein
LPFSQTFGSLLRMKSSLFALASLGILAFAGPSHGQEARTPQGAGAAASPAAAAANPPPAAGEAGATGNPTMTNEGSKNNVGGYSYSDGPARKAVSGVASSKAVRWVHRTSNAIASYPTFEANETGSVLRVQLSKSVNVTEETIGNGVVVYHLAGAQTHKWNDRNPLVTSHFNTPLRSARLFTDGRRGLALEIDLRASAKPTFAVESGEKGAAVLKVTFPAGSFLSENADEEAKETIHGVHHRTQNPRGNVRGSKPQGKAATKSEATQEPAKAPASPDGSKARGL